MIKLIVFDLDGVLVEAKLIHYHALNKALAVYGFKIGWDEHIAKYDGLPTRKKLEKLTCEKGLDPSLYSDIWQLKQKETINVVKEFIKLEDYIEQQKLLEYLVNNGYKVFIASNSITESIRCMLSCSGLIHYVHRYYSNEDVRSPKPHSEIYTKCILDAGVNPKETLIIEDSHIGRKSAHESGAQVMGVLGVHEVTITNVQKAINKANKYQMFRPKWQGGKMNVLIPMAGAGSRFEKAGYTFPKPLIDINGRPMIQIIVENINISAQHIFVCQKEHYEKYNLQHVLQLISPECKIIKVDSITEGAACTTLLAKEFINNDEPLLIANSDQFVDWDSNEFLYSCNTDNIDGSILTFTNTHPKWSYVKLDNNGYVIEVKEKVPISNIATVGIYYYRKGSDYVKYAEQMIRKNIRVNNEFYTCPVFNEFIQDGKKIKTYHIDKMWGLGTPEDLQLFMKDREI
jgi:beta-phosphoglucomutase-like phosphatase (HAD superfamily)/dTDP-glucose pyrophosphorylase